MRPNRKLAVWVGAVLALAAWAADPPHTTYLNKTVDCDSCHQLHSGAGGDLTIDASNANLCQSCHAAGGTASALPVNSGDMANLNTESGIHHGFGVVYNNAALATTLPTDAEMKRTVTGYGNRVVCSTCHDQHSGANRSGTQDVLPISKTAGSGAGTVAVGTVAAAANPKAYLIDLVTAGAVGASRFRLSNDNGTSWWGWNGSAWVAYNGSNGRATAASVALNDGTNVNVAFAGSFAVGDQWYFHVAYPFLRAALDSGDNTTGSKFCRDCHTGWAMDWTALETYNGTKRQHPVGVVLNANGRGYDRAAPLDGNGAAGSVDGNASNDLKLDGTNRIQCWTCHGMHYADSNTASVDGP